MTAGENPIWFEFEAEENDLWGAEGVLGFPIDCDAVLAHLEQDMRDDWFRDTLSFRDLLEKKGDLKNIISQLLLEGNGIYKGDIRALRDVPKKGLGIRYALETDFYDRFIYQAICSFLIRYFDPILSHRVLSHRYNPRRKKEKYLFKNRVDSWNTFEGIGCTAFEDGRALLITDITNFYENITIDNIKNSFEENIPKVSATGKEKLQIRNAINTLCSLLKKWSFSGRHGLPQNRDASSFIANMVLCDVDL